MILRYCYKLSFNVISSIAITRRGFIYMKSNSTKKKYTVEIAGIPLSIITDEEPAYVNMLTRIIDERITDATSGNMHISPLDAALLCSLDYLSDKLKAEKRVKSLDSQLESAKVIYESKLKRLEEENAELRARLTDGTADADDANEDPTPEVGSDTKKISDILLGTSPHEDKVKALENYLDSKNSESENEDGQKSQTQTREEKIKYIESLLRGN